MLFTPKRLLQLLEETPPRFFWRHARVGANIDGRLGLQTRQSSHDSPGRSISINVRSLRPGRVFELGGVLWETVRHAGMLGQVFSCLRWQINKPSNCCGCFNLIIYIQGDRLRPKSASASVLHHRCMTSFCFLHILFFFIIFCLFRVTPPPLRNPSDLNKAFHMWGLFEWPIF